jgi:predicted 3-demethylubiquinone-9 3-methyltransferase (glyoxalase superfamily)
MTMSKISPCLWFNDQAEEAAKFYTSIFKNSKIFEISRYTKAGNDVHGRPAGSVMAVSFELDGTRFAALNGGPAFTFTEAISLQIDCKDQQEVDYYWERLTAGGGKPVQCGWLKDKYGLSWQVVPTALKEMLMDKDTARAARVMDTMLKMVKLDIATLRKAYAG